MPRLLNINPRACSRGLHNYDIINNDIMVTSHLNGHGVVLGEGLVFEYPHEGVDSDGGVEVVKAGSTAHGDQEGTG